MSKSSHRAFFRRPSFLSRLVHHPSTHDHASEGAEHASHGGLSSLHRHVLSVPVRPVPRWRILLLALVGLSAGLSAGLNTAGPGTGPGTALSDNELRSWWPPSLAWMESKAFASALPADFVLKKLVENAQNAGLVALEGTVQGLDVNATPLKLKIYLKEGKARRELNGAITFFPASSSEGGSRKAVTTSSSEDDEEARLPVFEALMVPSSKTLLRDVQRLGVNLGSVGTEAGKEGKGAETVAPQELSRVRFLRQPTPDASLPWRVLLRAGAGENDSPFIDVDKDKFWLRRAQLRLPDGGLWLAEYDGHGLIKELPWLPTRITLYRSGIRMETVTFASRLTGPFPDGLFSGAAVSPTSTK